MMRTVYLHGRLKKFGFKHRLSVATLGEAVRAFSCQVDGFDAELRKGSYQIVVGDKKTGYQLGEDQINDFKMGQGDLHIMPAVKGAKRGGIMKIILGVALIGAAFLFAPAAGGLAAGIGGTGFTYGNMALMGVGLALAGASQMLTPKQKTKKSKSDESFTIQGPGNAYEQGNPVPLVYGHNVIVGSQLISGGVDIQDYAKAKAAAAAQNGAA